jgi:hypothetical protein
LTKSQKKRERKNLAKFYKQPLSLKASKDVRATPTSQIFDIVH